MTVVTEIGTENLNFFVVFLEISDLLGTLQRNLRIQAEGGC